MGKYIVNCIIFASLFLLKVSDARFLFTVTDEAGKQMDLKSTIFMVLYLALTFFAFVYFLYKSIKRH